MHNAYVSIHELNFIGPIQCVAAQAAFVPKLQIYPLYIALKSVSTNATETLIPAEPARPVTSAAAITAALSGSSEL